MRSRTEKLSSKRSIINHDHLITDEACMIGIYREGGDLSIYAESSEGIEHFSINRGNSLDMVILPWNLGASSITSYGGASSTDSSIKNKIS